MANPVSLPLGGDPTPVFRNNLLYLVAYSDLNLYD